MEGLLDTAGKDNELEGCKEHNEFESKSDPPDPKLFQFLQENKIRSGSIYDDLTAMDLEIDDLNGVEPNDLDTLCESLQLSISDKIKFKKAINTNPPSPKQHIPNNAFINYILADSVTPYIINNESTMPLLIKDQAKFNKNSNREISMTVAGEGGVGKSSIVKKILYDQYVEEYAPTIEDDYDPQEIQIKDLPPLTINILDTAGQDEYQSMRQLWIKKCHVILLVYSITSYISFECIEQKWMDLITESARNCNLMILVGNKCDLEEKRQVNSDQAHELANNYGMLFMEVSAKTGMNVKLMIYNLVSEIINRDMSAKKDENICLERLGNTKRKKKCLCGNL